MRILAGIYKPTEGICLYRGKSVFDQPQVKKNYSGAGYAGLYSAIFAQGNARFLSSDVPSFSESLFARLSEVFRLNPRARLKTFSRACNDKPRLLLAISASPDLLLLDEAFDGLDPVSDRS